jgi:hypothetical protein
MPYWTVTIYSICFLASACSAGLLLRAWHRNGDRHFAWIGACFGMLAINNLLAILHDLVLPDTDFFAYRSLVTFAGLSILIYGFIWEAE